CWHHSGKTCCAPQRSDLNPLPANCIPESHFLHAHCSHTAVRLLDMSEPAELLIIKDQYELAQQFLNCGSAAEEADNKSDALVYYKKGRLHLTQGLEIPIGGERQQGKAWDKARQLQQKMKDMLGTIDTRLSNLEMSTRGDTNGLLLDVPSNLYPDLIINGQSTNSSVHQLYPTIPDTSQSTSPARISPISPAVLDTHTLPAAGLETVAMDNSDLPPAYTPKPRDGHRSLAYDPIGGGLWSGVPTDGKELLTIPSGVQLFFVEPNGQVSSLSYPGYLRIIAVCDRLYPLTAETPVLLANSGIFMFPDYLTELPGSYVGLVLSSELPAADCEMFHDLLSQLADLRIQVSLRLKCGWLCTLVEPILPGWNGKPPSSLFLG
ncbi:hypothetical protein GOODEAATRI_013151, partial [Goodea atripinnis]